MAADKSASEVTDQMKRTAVAVGVAMSHGVRLRVALVDGGQREGRVIGRHTAKTVGADGPPFLHFTLDDGGDPISIAHVRSGTILRADSDTE